MDKFLRYHLFYFIVYLLLIVCEILMCVYNFHPWWLESFVLVGILLTAILQVVAWIMAIVKGKSLLVWDIFGFGIVSFVLFFIMLFVILATDGMGDDFGKRHPIPENMNCSLPNEKFEMMSIDSLNPSTWLLIHDGLQGGIYEYVYFSPALSDGYIYLKCYEATENILLSDEDVFERSKNSVGRHTSFGPVGSKREFTIYEGSWGDYYAVRVEVWFHDASLGCDCKLNQKTYKLQGWQR